MKRTKHGLSHYRLTTLNMGHLTPIGCFEVLPGDSLQQGTSMLLRCNPLVAPVMHPVHVRVHHWFVPHRLVWSGWEDFITGGPDGLGGSAGAYPVLSGPVAPYSLADYLGVPPGITGTTYSALPTRSYNLIFNEYYRDQDLEAEVAQDFGAIQRVSWGKDYFTTARPWSQKGPEVTLPLGTTAPVISAGDGQPQFWLNGSGAPGFVSSMFGASGQPGVSLSGAAPNSGPLHWSSTKLQADLTQATSVDVNVVRRAFALQRYEEARAQYGSRYTEYLRYLGVRSSDARLQRPEYLGGGKATISFSEVLKTGATEDPADPIGSMFGHGIAAMRSRRYRRFFEEHGLVLSLLSVVPRSIYTNGLERMWSRRAKEDYWQAELERIGQQEVYQKEVFAEAGGTPDQVFGYQDRYAEYRHIPSQVTAEFRGLLNYWHMARDFAAPPVLNSDFVKCDPGMRNFAEQTGFGLLVMANHSIQARRMVTKSVIGRVI